MPPRHDQLDINDAILEVIEVTRSELLRNDVSDRTRKGLAAHSRRSHPTATDSAKLDHERRRSDERRQRGVARFSDTTAEDISNGVLVTVRDSGPGLNPESLERLFDAFHTTKPGGMGMRLSICRSIIEAHGGQVWAAPNLPQGATFHFSVPLHQEVALLGGIRRPPRDPASG